jgi:hypothetical protein
LGRDPAPRSYNAGIADSPAAKKMLVFERPCRPSFLLSCHYEENRSYPPGRLLLPGSRMFAANRGHARRRGFTYPSASNHYLCGDEGRKHRRASRPRETTGRQYRTSRANGAVRNSSAFSVTNFLAPTVI